MKTIRERMADAIADACEDGDVVTGWVSTVEVIRDDGTRHLLITSSDGSTLWQVVGMAEYTAEWYRSQVVQ